MEIDESKAVSYYTRSLSPNVQQALARAKDVAQRVLPAQPAAQDSAQRMDTTNVTLVVDPTLRLVVDRVTDTTTGAVLSLLPTADPPISQPSPQISSAAATTSAPPRQIAESRPADRSVTTSVQVVEARYKEAGRAAEPVPDHAGKTTVTV